MIKKIAHRFLKKFGLQITRIQTPAMPKSLTLALNNMEAGIYRSKQRGIQPETVIDVGAAEGKWTLNAMNIWKDSHFLLLEPLQERTNILTTLEKNHSNIHFVNAGAGDKKGNVQFFVTDDLDGSGIADNGSNTEKRTIEITTIDDEINRLQLKGPYLIKLDTHGYEIPILSGANQTLKNTELVIIECYGFQIAPGSLLFWEMCQLMCEKGFRLVDIVDVMRRDKDQAFWQCDAFFISEKSPVFDSKTYH